MTTTSTIVALDTADHLCCVKYQGQWWLAIFYESVTVAQEAYRPYFSAGQGLTEHVRQAVTRLMLRFAYRGAVAQLLMDPTEDARFVDVPDLESPDFERHFYLCPHILYEDQLDTAFPDDTTKNLYKNGRIHLNRLLDDLANGKSPSAVKDAARSKPTAAEPTNEPVPTVDHAASTLRKDHDDETTMDVEDAGEPMMEGEDENEAHEADEAFPVADDDAPLVEAAVAPAADSPAPLKRRIQPHDTWEKVLETIRLSWDVYPFNNKTCFFKPNRHGQTEGVDYLDEAGLQEYSRRHFGWIGPAHHTPDQRTKPQDPAKPLLDSNVIDVPREEYYKFRNVWKRLQLQGWKFVHHMLTDRYAPPNAPKDGGVDGVDWFSNSNELTEWCIEQDRKNGITFLDSETPEKLSRELLDEFSKENKQGDENVSNKRSLEKKSTDKKSKRRKKSKEDSSKATPFIPTMKYNKTNRHWWKKKDIPCYDDVKRILVKLGYEKDRFVIPASMDENLDEDIEFASGHGMGMFFVYCGIPGYDRTKLNDREDETLQRWVRFINVPKRSKRNVKKISSPNENKQHAILTNVNFQTSCGRFYVPGSDRMEGGRTSRKAGVHFFDTRDLNTSVRVHVRGFPFLLSSWMIQPDMEKEHEEEIVQEALEEERINRDDEKYLEARLWGAASSQDLPQFTYLPNTYILRALQSVDSETLGPEEGSVEESEDEVVPQSASKHYDADVDDEVGLVQYPKDRYWYRMESLPSHADVKHLLGKMGFEAVGGASGGWSHARSPSFGSVHELREFGARHNLPGRENLTDLENVALDRWLDFVHVPGVNASNTVERCQEVPIVSEAKFTSILLSKCRFQYLDNLFYPPGADVIRRQRASADADVASEKPVKTDFTLKELKRFIITNKKLELIDGASDGSTMTESDELKIRLFAATDPPARKEYIFVPDTAVHDEAVDDAPECETSLADADVDESVSAESHFLFTQYGTDKDEDHLSCTDERPSDRRIDEHSEVQVLSPDQGESRRVTICPTTAKAAPLATDIDRRNDFDAEMEEIFDELDRNPPPPLPILARLTQFYQDSHH